MWVDLFTNRFFWVPLFTGMFAQLLKFVLYAIRKRRVDFRWLITTGGMPSSHSASVMALSTLVGLQEGFRSPLFGVTLYFSVIVMYDAAGLRRAAGKQASVLNRIIEELAETHTISQEHLQERLMELLGHTPMEVLAGALLGIVIGVIFS